MTDERPIEIVDRHTDTDSGTALIGSTEVNSPFYDPPMFPEAQLEDSGSGLAPVGDRWFAVNVRDTPVVDGGKY